jgi:hypothetical protein
MARDSAVRNHALLVASTKKAAKKSVIVRLENGSPRALAPRSSRLTQRRWSRRRRSCWSWVKRAVCRCLRSRRAGSRATALGAGARMDSWRRSDRRLHRTCRSASWLRSPFANGARARRHRSDERRRTVRLRQQARDALESAVVRSLPTKSQLSACSSARARPRLLAKDTRAARNSAEVGCQRLPPRRAFAADLIRASRPIATARAALRH